jgi:hypothetical protein
VSDAGPAVLCPSARVEEALRTLSGSGESTKNTLTNSPPRDPISKYTHPPRT